MKGLLNFLRTTLLGGLLFLVPIVAFVFIIEKAVALSHKLVQPVATHLPFKSLLGLDTPKFIAVGVLVLFCFLAGLLAKARFAKRSVVWLENTVLSFIPGYEFIKSMATMTVGQQDVLRQVVLVRIEDALQIGFVVERIDDNRAVVFVPDTPNPRTGAVFFMTNDRFEPTDISPAAAMKCLRRHGTGAAALLRGRLADTAETGTVNESTATKED